MEHKTLLPEWAQEIKSKHLELKTALKDKAHLTPVFQQFFEDTEAVLQALETEKRKVERAKTFIYAFTQWEADMIETGEVWATEDGLPKLTQELYDRWVEGPNSLQNLRNEALRDD